MKNLILNFDTETSGIPDWKSPSGGADQPHLVSLAARLVDKDTREAVKEIDVIIKPDGWDWGVNDEAFEIHGITFDRAMEEGVPEAEAVHAFMELANGEDVDYTVAFNNVFDIRMVRIALKRYFPDLAPAWKDKRRHCVMRAFKKLDEFHKQPKLIEAYLEVTGEEHDAAHNAMGDVLAMERVYWYLVDTYGVDAIHILGEK